MDYDGIVLLGERTSKPKPVASEVIRLQLLFVNLVQHNYHDKVYQRPQTSLFTSEFDDHNAGAQYAWFNMAQYAWLVLATWRHT